jgi:hypothetical protein
MKHLKKFNESASVDFLSESELKEILLEFSDLDLTYTIKYKSFKLHDNWFMPVREFRNSSEWDSYNEQGDFHKGYQVSFGEFYKDGYSATDVQRGDNQRVFGVPTEKMYKFFELVKEVQYTIESMGYLFLLSTHRHGEFDFMIIENK